MEFEKILKLIDAVAESGLSGLELEENGSRLHLENLAASEKICKGGEPYGERNGTVRGNAVHVKESSAAEGDNTTAAKADGDITGSGKETQSAGKTEDHTALSGETVRAPLVGTFYSAPAEGEKAFVKPGDRVTKGQILGIIEAMKLMNEIESEYDGIVEAVLVNNEQVVEYGQPLFSVKTDS